MTSISDWLLSVRRGLRPQNTPAEQCSSGVYADALLEKIQQVVFRIDIDGRFKFLNQAWEKLTGYGTDESRGIDWLEFIHPQDRNDCSAQFNALLQRDTEHCVMLLRLINRQGESRWAELRANVAAANEVDGVHVVGTLTEVDARVKRDRQLQASHRTLGNLLDALPGMAYRCRNNHDRTVEYVNAGSLELTGYAPAELTNSKDRPLGELVHPDHRDGVWDELQLALAEDRPFNLIYPIVSRSGREIWVWDRGKAIYTTSGESLGLEGFITDITQIKTNEERGARNALFDIGSGLPKRSLFIEHVQHAIEEGKTRKDYRFALLILQVGQLEKALERAPPEAADRAVLELTQRIRAVLEPADIVARLETTSFGILLDRDSHLRKPSRVASRIHEALLSPIPVADTDVFVQSTIGIALSGSRHQHSEDILKDATAALARARELGGGRTEVFDTHEHAKAATQVRMERELGAAIEQGQFEVYWQPLVRARDNSVAGFEARLGWHHPRRGLLFAGDFVPTAEDAQLIMPLWELMLAQVCHQLEEWQQPYAAMGLAVNVQIMGNTLLDADFFLRLGEHLLAALPKPFRLALGFPEAVISRDPKTVQRMIERLSGSDSVQLIVDDFGGGTSALSVLREVPVDVVRLDRSLTEGNPDLARFTSAVIAMAHALDIRVVADGIHTEQQLAEVCRVGCDYVQGSHISTPIDANSAQAMLKAMQSRPTVLTR